MQTGAHVTLYRSASRTWHYTADFRRIAATASGADRDSGVQARKVYSPRSFGVGGRGGSRQADEVSLLACLPVLHHPHGFHAEERANERLPWPFPARHRSRERLAQQSPQPWKCPVAVAMSPFKLVILSWRLREELSNAHLPQLANRSPSHRTLAGRRPSANTTRDSVRSTAL